MTYIPSMTRGTQVEVGGLRVDRPMWEGLEGRDDRRRPPPTRGNGIGPPAPRSLPPRSHPTRPQHPVDVDLTTPDPGRPLVQHARTSSEPARTAATGQPRVEIDLTAPDPTRGRVDIDLTTERPWEDPEGRSTAHGVDNRGIERMLRQDHAAGSPDRTPTSAARQQRRNQWWSRKYRHAVRRVRRPARSVKVERHLAVLAVGVGMLAVLATLAAGVRTKLADESEFVSISAPLHKEPEVADQLSRTIANDLVSSGAVEAPRALDVKLVVEDVIASDNFNPAWRHSLSVLHKKAFKWNQPGVKISEAAPALAVDLEEQNLASSEVIRKSHINLVHDSYASDLQTLSGQLDRVVTLGVPVMIALSILVLRRTRNRYRASGIMAGTCLLGAAAFFVFAPWLSAIAVDLVLRSELRPLANGAFSGILPSLRVLAVGLATVAATLLVASRLEEVRLTPYITQRRRRSSKGEARREAAAVVLDPAPLSAVGDGGF